eukprot:1159990-Pelagomonas_calceolata.AAC.1
MLEGLHAWTSSKTEVRAPDSGAFTCISMPELTPLSRHASGLAGNFCVLPEQRWGLRPVHAGFIDASMEVEQSFKGVHKNALGVCSFQLQLQPFAAPVAPTPRTVSCWSETS